jgi:3-hydroxyisobutyrate dehydrogenase-like beta-hydroxyacid dehydrogenase
MAARIGFVGATGLMGHGMAKNLIKKGVRFFVPAPENARAPLPP